MALRFVALSARGGAMVSLLTDGPVVGIPPVQKDLDDWIAVPPIAHTAVIVNGRADPFLSYYQADKEHYFIYRLPDMTLVSHTLYDVNMALDRLDGLLGGNTDM